MSNEVHVSRGEDSALRVTVGTASITITELRIRSMSNFKTPYLVLGEGQSSIALDTEQMMSLVAEYLRFEVVSSDVEPVRVEKRQVGWHFLCEYVA